MKLIVKKIYNNLPQITAEMSDKVEAAVRKTTFDISATAKLSMGPPKHGQQYQRYGKIHTASAPGEAPAIDTGNLVNSIREEFPSSKQGVVFTGVEYAPGLEFGSLKVLPRPFFIPAAEKVWPKFIAALKSLIPGG